MVKTSPQGAAGQVWALVVGALALCALLSACDAGSSGTGTLSENPTFRERNTNEPDGLLLEIDEISPPLGAVTRPGSTIQFAIQLGPGHKAHPPTFRWAIDGKPVKTADNRRTSLQGRLDVDPEALAPGTHAVTATVSARGRDAALAWELQVPETLLANRPPVVLQTLPPGSCEVARGDEVRLLVVAADVDAGDALAYRWSVDGEPLPGDLAEIWLPTATLSPGTHEVLVEVTDGAEHAGRDPTRCRWSVLVKAAGEPVTDHIAAAWPAGTPRLAGSGALRFEVDVESSGMEEPACRWEVDGVEQRTTGLVFDFDPQEPESHLEGGVHRITCSLRDGPPAGAGDAGEAASLVAPGSVGWTVSLQPASAVAGKPAGGRNRPPAVRSTKPARRVAAVPGEPAVFSVDAADPDGDVLTYRWFVDGVAQPGDGPVFVHTPGMELFGRSSVVEVRAQDGHDEAGGLPAADHGLGAWIVSPAPASLLALTPSADAVILDNGQAGTSAQGDWRSSGGSNPYGGGSLYTKSAGDTYAYILSLPRSGKYEVLLWWTAWSSRSSKVPVTIQHQNGTSTVTVNQLASGGQWNSVGTWDFTSSAKVTIISEGGGLSTCADAVCLNPSGSPPPEPEDPPPASSEIVIDDGAAGTSSVGSWPASSGPNPYGGRSLYAKASGSYTFSRSLAAAGTYDVYAWWTEWPSRESRVPYEVTHTGGTTTVIKNQLADGGRWNLLGSYSFGSLLKVTVRVPGSASVCADAVRFVPTGSPPPEPDPTPPPPDNPSPEFVIDDGEAGTSSVGSWSASSGPNPYGGRSLYAKASGSYTFSRSLVAAGTYDVYAWWTEWSSREQRVPYEIAHTGGTSTVYKDQKTGGGRWNFLGRYSFGSQAKITIRVPGSASVCADAVRFVAASGSPPPETGSPVTLSWDAPTTNADGTPLTDLAGFKVYWGTSSRSYGTPGDAGNATSYTIPSLAAGTYYFAVTAYDTSGNESSFSAEVTATLP